MLGEKGRLPRSKVTYINYIHSIGCNVLGLKSLWYTYQDHDFESVDSYYEKLVEDLKEMLSCDADYNQLGLIQLSNIRKEHIEAVHKHLPVVFTREVKGGHGNKPLTLFGIDLTAMAPEQRHKPVPPSFLNQDEGDDDE